MFTFFFILYYNEYGDNMKDTEQIMINISTMNDIEKLKKNNHIKYINLDIEDVNLDVIYYLLENGQDYYYTELTKEKRGYIYVPYHIFKTSELFILKILNNIPVTFNRLEIARYLYITIGKNIGYDINIIPEKNDIYHLENEYTINNIWGSIHQLKGTNTSFTNLYAYLCHIMGLTCKTIAIDSNNLKNIVTVDNRNITIDITEDIPYIEAGFKTKYFTGYNDNLYLDRKIGYIQNDYNDNLIDNYMNVSSSNHLEDFLNKINQYININNMKAMEFGIIFEQLFNKYWPDYEIRINNLYVNNYPNKEHFIIFSCKDKYYSYNYTKKYFVEIKEEELKENINKKKIGIYQNEKIPFLIHSIIKEETYGF